VGNLYLGSNALDAAAVVDVQSVASLLGGSATNAINYLKNTVPSNLLVLTPVSGSQVPLGDGPPQEMWIMTQDNTTLLISTVPEGGAALLYLLLGGGACFGAMFLSSRSRLGRSEAA
jgi:hypothetical protein